MVHWENLQAWDQAVQAALAAEDFLRALDALVQGYQHVVVGYCSNLLGDAGRGEEVAQKAFVAAYEAMPRFRRQASVRTWLFAIARKLCLKEAVYTARHQRILTSRWQGIREAAHTTPPASPEEQYLNWENEQLQAHFIERLPHYLRQLDHGERDMLTLYYYAGFTYTDIARTIRTSLQTVRRRIARALAHLEALMIEDMRHDKP